MATEYCEGFDAALSSVPIVSAEYATLERERDQLKARVDELRMRLFECESAMLLGHEAAMLKYMEQYPKPIEKPAS